MRHAAAANELAPERLTPRWLPLEPSPPLTLGVSGLHASLPDPKIFAHRGGMMRAMTGFNALREHSRITWIEQEHGWAATPEDIVTVLSNEGFEECKREQTTSRRNRRPAGGLWQGVNPRTGSVASAIWVNRPAWPHDIVFIEVDGESLAGGEGELDRDVPPLTG